MTRLEFIMEFEGGEVSEDDIQEHFQSMIDDGTVWHLQGFYGRTARDLIEHGICYLPDNKPVEGANG